MADTSHPLSSRPHLLPLSLLQPTPLPPPIPGGGAGNNGSRYRCGDGPGAGVAAGPPTPPISDALIPPRPPTYFPSPRSRHAGGAADTRRRWQQREPVPVQRRARNRRRQQREAAVAASGGGEIKKQWLTLFLGRTCKRGSNQAALRDDPDQPRTGSNNQQDKCQDKRDKIAR
jgi:hypothetical protein